MGVVYRAMQLELSRPVALKMLLGDAHVGAEALARFRTEAVKLARAEHPYIVHVYEVGEHEGHPYFAMEYVSGGSLAQRLAAAPLSASEAARLLERLARAMHVAHERGLVHRDLKPANVLLAEDGTPKISDFGLAKAVDADAGQTRTGAVLGTPSYMAPEQAAGRNREIGPTTDIYALGAILYEALTGRPPFRAESAWETIAQVLNDDPVPVRTLQPKVPRDLERICMKCLRKEPAGRYATAAELEDDLRCFREGRPVRARPVSPIQRAWKWARRRPALASLFVFGCLAVLGIAFGLSEFRVLRERADYEGQLRQERHWQALVDQARAERLSGNRWRALELLKEAAAFRKTDELRREAVAALLSPAMRLVLDKPIDACRRMQFGAADQLLAVEGKFAADEPSKVEVWELPSGRVIFRADRDGWQLGGNNMFLLSPAPLAGDTCLAVTTLEKGLHLWDLRTGEAITRISGYFPVAFSPDGHQLATTDNNG
jgi:hypothetical protein